MNRPILQSDLGDPDLFNDGIPHTAFRAIREHDGLVWNPDSASGSGFWSVGRYRDVAFVSRNEDVFSSAAGHIQIFDIDEDALPHRASMIDMDPPQHTRLRRLVNPGFIPRTIKLAIPTIRERAGVLLDIMRSKGGGDWVSGIAKPIPIGLICDMLGVPPEDHALMIELTDYLVAGTSKDPLDPDAYGNTIPLKYLPFNSPAAFAMTQYAHALAEKRRQQPRDDLVSKLVSAEIDGERLTDDEVSNFFRLLIFAGNETTRSAMAHMALQMAEFPGQFERAREDPSLLDSLVEEIVRYASPILYFRRTATRDTEVAGTPVAKGEKLVMWYASANFDAERFEDPMHFDAGRNRTTPHAGYGGGGIHTCLGAGLARLEIKILLEELFTRNLAIELAGTPEYVRSNFVNGVEHLPVRLVSR